MRMALFAPLGLVLATAPIPANAVEVVWADWISADATNATGTLDTTTPISIEFSSPSGFGFVETGTGINYWTEPNPAALPYTGGVVENAPPASELIALSNAGEKTITFGEAISGLYLAIISWNGNAAQFDQPFQIISEGQGYWGNGSITLGPDNTFVASGEPHGIIYFPGTFSSLTFTDTSNEFWHGLTVGVKQLASEVPDGAVPEPSTWTMMLAGFALAGIGLRRRKRPALLREAMA